MPSYVNIGAYVDREHDGGYLAGRELCADRKGMHLSGGVGIGGVLSRCKLSRDRGRWMFIGGRLFR
jgi:tetrahydrodipicolinate N-succinyltransferase